MRLASAELQVDSFSKSFLQGTSDLAMRVGLNSGPTTAGVLRGAKARFQLFGDVRQDSYLLVLAKSIVMLTSLCT
jgi:class 3 adenylate cyclase